MKLHVKLVTACGCEKEDVVEVGEIPEVLHRYLSYHEDRIELRTFKPGDPIIDNTEYRTFRRFKRTGENSVTYLESKGNSHG